MKRIGQNDLGDILAQTELIPVEKAAESLGLSQPQKIESPSTKQIELNRQKTSDGPDLVAIEDAQRITQEAESHHIVMRNSSAN